MIRATKLSTRDQLLPLLRATGPDLVTLYAHANAVRREHCGEAVPIRAVSYLGIALALLGLLYAVVVLTAKVIVGNPVKGWTPLMIVVLVLGGAQMLTLGVFGEYLWRILVQVQRRNPYLIETILPPRDP